MTTYGYAGPDRSVIEASEPWAERLARAHVEVMGRAASVSHVDGTATTFGPPTAEWSPPADELVEILVAAERPVVLAGPGVVRSGVVPGLHALATSADLGVLNTWGAKGIFDWRSKHHLATAGLQRDDFDLAGLAESDLVLACGVDPAETPPSWSTADSQVRDIPLGSLSSIAERWRRTPAEIEFPPLRAGLGAATQEAWTTTSTPLHPAVATRLLSARLGRSGFLAAAPGSAGFWVARTFPTTALRTVSVPATGERSSAIVAAIVATLSDPDRPVVALWDGDPDDELAELLDLASSLGVRLTVECWHPDGHRMDAEAYDERLASLLAESGSSTPSRVVEFGVDARALDSFVEVAGPITAWPDLDMPRS